MGEIFDRLLLKETSLSESLHLRVETLQIADVDVGQLISLVMPLVTSQVGTSFVGNKFKEVSISLSILRAAHSILDAAELEKRKLARLFWEEEHESCYIAIPKFLDDGHDDDFLDNDENDANNDNIIINNSNVNIKNNDGDNSRTRYRDDYDEEQQQQQHSLHEMSASTRLVLEKEIINLEELLQQEKQNSLNLKQKLWQLQDAEKEIQKLKKEKAGLEQFASTTLTSANKSCDEMRRLQRQLYRCGITISKLCDLSGRRITGKSIAPKPIAGVISKMALAVDYRVIKTLWKLDQNRLKKSKSRLKKRLVQMFLRYRSHILLQRVVFGWWGKTASRTLVYVRALLALRRWNAKKKSRAFRRWKMAMIRRIRNEGLIERREQYWIYRVFQSWKEIDKPSPLQQQISSHDNNINNNNVNNNNNNSIKESGADITTQLQILSQILATKTQNREMRRAFRGWARRTWMKISTK